MYKVLVCVVNNNRSVLEGLQGQFGGKLYSSNFKTKPAHWRPSFQWHLWGDDCERFLRAVRPYLRIKGALADSALEFFALQHLRGVKRDIAPDVWERMKVIHMAHRELQQKGSVPRRTKATSDAFAFSVPESVAEAVATIKESGQLELELAKAHGISM
jgi:hypothetical protein